MLNSGSSICFGAQTDLDLDPVLQLPGSGPLGKSFVSLSLSFPTCKWGFLLPAVLRVSGRSGEGSLQGQRIRSPVPPSAYFPPLDEEKLAGFPFSWPSLVSQYLIPPHAPDLWKGAAGSSQEALINAATGLYCEVQIRCPHLLHYTDTSTTSQVTSSSQTAHLKIRSPSSSIPRQMVPSSPPLQRDPSHRTRPCEKEETHSRSTAGPVTP